MLQSRQEKLQENSVNIHGYKKECVSFALPCKKIMESPLMCPEVQHMSSLPLTPWPEVKNAVAISEKLLGSPKYEARYTASECDKGLAQCKTLSVRTIKKSSKISYSCKLEEFLGRFVIGRVCSSMRCLLTCSHGQAAVERGFSDACRRPEGEGSSRTVLSTGCNVWTCSRWSPARTPHSTLQRSKDEIWAVPGGWKGEKNTKLLMRGKYRTSTMTWKMSKQKNDVKHWAKRQTKRHSV